MQCYILRIVDSQRVVVSISSTGAVLCVKLDTPLDVYNPLAITALTPAKAMIQEHGEFDFDEQILKNVKLDVIDWPRPVAYPRYRLVVKKKKM
jgi:hypothetical protein